MPAPTQHLERRPASAPAARPGSERTAGTVAALAGGAGVVAAVLPAGWPVGLVLAAVAVVLGVRSMRRGPEAPGFGGARMGLAFGLIGVLLSLVGAAMWALS